MPQSSKYPGMRLKVHGEHFEFVTAEGGVEQGDVYNIELDDKTVPKRVKDAVQCMFAAVASMRGSPLVSQSWSAGFAHRGVRGFCDPVAAGLHGWV